MSITTFSINNTFTTVDPGNPGVDSLIKKILGYQVNGWQYIKKTKKSLKNWDGSSSFYHTEGHVFLTGLFSFVKAIFEKYNIPHEIIDFRKIDSFFIPKEISYGDVTLRPYQKKCVEDFFNAGGRGTIKAGTGSGKTEIGIAVIDVIKKPTLWLTHRVNLCRQTERRLKKRIPGLKDRVGIVGNGEYSPNFITFATTRTLQIALKKEPEKTIALLEKFELLVVDEAHRMKAKEFFQASSHCINAKYRLALTATPFMREDPFENLMLKGAVGKVVSEVETKMLIEKGFLATPFFKYINITNPILNEHSRDWAAIYSDGIIENKTRNETIGRVASEMISSGKRVLITCQKVEHCDNIKPYLPDGIEALSGADSFEIRDKALDNLAAGKTKGILSTPIFDEGIDVTEIDAVIYAGGGKSGPALIQAAGRAMRPKPKNNHAIIVDFVDQSHPMLLKHSLARFNHVRKQPGFVVLNGGKV